MDQYSSDVISFQGSFYSNCVNFGGVQSSGSGDKPGNAKLVNYETDVVRKPKINGVELIGNKSSEDLNIRLEETLTSISQNGVKRPIVDKNVDIEAPEKEMTYNEMLDIWKQYFG